MNINLYQAPKPGFIRNLRRAGFKIRIKHFRVAQLAVTPEGVAATLKTALFLITKQNRSRYSHIASNGGMTTLDVTFPDGMTLLGIADCAPEDTYNKRLGTYIAFQRVVADRKALTAKE